MSDQGTGSSAQPKRHLWFTPQRDRFFLVPQDLTLPPGDLEVRSLAAVRASLSEESLGPYEVDIDAARAHVDAGVGEVAGQVRGLWETLKSSIGGSPSSQEPVRVDWLGVTPGEAITDPEKARIARKSLVERAAQFVGADLSTEQLSRFEERLDRLGSAVVRDAERLRSGTSDLAEGISVGIDKLEAKRPEIEASLEATGEALLEMGREAIARLQQVGRTEKEEPLATPEPKSDGPEPRVDDAEELGSATPERPR